MGSLMDRLTGNSEAWRPADYPEHPNPLVGKIVETEQGDGDFGPYPILFVVDADGNEWRVHGFGSVLQGRIAKLKPAPGDEIGIKYLGEEPAKNFPGKTYKNWKVVLEKGDGTNPVAPDWDGMAKAAEAAETEDDF